MRCTSTHMQTNIWNHLHSIDIIIKRYIFLTEHSPLTLIALAAFFPAAINRMNITDSFQFPIKCHSIWIVQPLKWLLHLLLYPIKLMVACLHIGFGYQVFSIENRICYAFRLLLSCVCLFFSTFQLFIEVTFGKRDFSVCCPFAHELYNIPHPHCKYIQCSILMKTVGLFVMVIAINYELCLF